MTVLDLTMLVCGLAIGALAGPFIGEALWNWTERRRIRGGGGRLR